MSESILQEAERICNGERNDDYGHPLDDYTRTAALWSTLLSDYLIKPIPAEKAALCMIAVKLSREVHKSKRDNLVDIAGYANVIDKIHKEKATREFNETTFGSQSKEYLEEPEKDVTREIGVKQVGYFAQDYVVHKNVKYMATDSIGRVKSFYTKPNMYKEDSLWYSINHTEVVGNRTDLTDWKNSLREV